uniref:Mitochondrial potassium channel ATP-binding subunit n=1 Tax=Brachionus plicatilis TaxID=10195 RepID=A0A7H9SQC7_BRAPC|nr:ATP-binding cassette transporter subfamily B member 8 [Brachionus plicatilis]
MSLGLLLLKKIGQNSSRRCINSFVFNQRSFFSSIIKPRVSALKQIRNKAGIGLVTAGFGYVAWNEFESYQQIEFLKRKIQEFLDCIGDSFRVQCDSEIKQNRTAFYEQTIGLDKNKKKKENFDWVELFKLIWKEKFYFLAAVASAFMVAMLNIQIPQDLGNLINSVYEMLKSNVANYESLYKPALSLIKLYIVQSLFTFSYIYTLGVMGENMASNLKNNLFSKMIKQDISFYDRSRSGELIDRLTSDIQEFKSSFKSCISQGLKAATQIIGCCVSLYLISPKLTLITSLVVPTAIAIGSFFGSILRKYSRKAQAQISKSTAVADEAINNVRTVRAFAMEDYEVEIFADEVEKARKLNIQLSLGIGIFQGVSNLFVNGMVLGVLYAGGKMLVSNEINAGQMMAYLTATQMIQRSFTQLSILFGQALRGLSSGARVFEFLKLVPSIPVDDVGAKIENLKGEIKFKNVSFRYPNREEANVLEDFNLEVKPGEIVAIVGHSGSGKSTVCSLLERFYDINEGKISIDGIDINDLSPNWLRRQAIGYISQEPILFATSISENIKYGKPDASNDEVMAAAKLANAHDFISSFPKQYGTVVGERGTTLSGGQKQRIAITRALLKNPKILILDEATSALDSKSERLVQETINNVIKGHTVIIVAHRLSTIQNADKIVVMHNGKIIEIGNHKKLMALKGHYYSLFNLQSYE